MKFNKLKLLLELTPEQKVAAHEYASRRAPNLSFGIFKEPRTYYPLKDQFIKLPVPKDIYDYLDQNGFKIIDYLEGIAYKKDDVEFKRPFRIGKILSDKIYLKRNFDARLRSKEYDYERLRYEKLNFSDVEIIDNKISLMVVLSHHPEDIAGMSTDRNWTSCMNLRDYDLNDPNYIPYPYKEVQYGGMAAYLTTINDREIEKPYARIAIKRFESSIGPQYFIFKAEPKSYGHIELAIRLNFKDFVYGKLNESNKITKNPIKDEAYLSTYGYLEQLPTTIIKGDINNLPFEKQLKIIISNPSELKDIKNPNKELQLIAVRHSGNALKYIKDPDKEVQLAAVTKSPDAIKFIDNPDRDVQMTAIKGDLILGFSLQYIRKPHPDVLEFLKSKNYKL